MSDAVHARLYENIWVKISCTETFARYDSFRLQCHSKSMLRILNYVLGRTLCEMQIGFCIQSSMEVSTIFGTVANWLAHLTG